MEKTHREIQEQNKIYDADRSLKETRLRPRLTEEFLQTLVEAARTTGWEHDYIEVQNFVERCFEIANCKESLPSLDPYEYGAKDKS